MNCYKRHSQACSREFEEEHFREELSSVSADLDTQNMMKEILVKLHKQDLDEDQVWDGLRKGDDNNDDEDEVVPGVSNERLRGLARGELQLEDLDDGERLVIKKSLLQDIQIEAWTPWWESDDVQDIRLSSDGRRLVQLVEEVDTDANQESVTNHIPSGPSQSIPPLASLLSKEPSDVILFHVLDVVYWYCLLLRLFNGDIELSGDQLMSVLVDNSVSMLRSNTGSKTGCFGGSKEAGSTEDVRAFAEGLLVRCQAAGFFSGLEARGIAAGVLNDAAAVFSLRRLGVLLALSDILQTAEAIRRQTNKDSVQQRKATLVQRKLVFLLSWANERVDPVATVVSTELVDVYKEEMELIKLQAGGEAELEQAVRLP